MNKKLMKPKKWSGLRFFLERMGFCFEGMRENGGLWVGKDCPIHGKPDIYAS